jgi:hypothetical protein
MDMQGIEMEKSVHGREIVRQPALLPVHAPPRRRTAVVSG